MQHNAVLFWHVLNFHTQQVAMKIPQLVLMCLARRGGGGEGGGGALYT